MTLTFPGARVLSLGLLILAGCGPAVTDAQLGTTRNALGSDPTLRANFVAECQRRETAKPAAGIAYMATVLRVSPAAAPRVFCQRMTDGVIAGKLTSADLNATANGTFSPRLLQVLQGA